MVDSVPMVFCVLLIAEEKECRKIDDHSYSNRIEYHKSRGYHL